MRPLASLMVNNRTDERARLWLRCASCRAWAVDLDPGASVVVPAPAGGVRAAASITQTGVTHLSASVELPPIGGILVARLVRAPDGVERFSFHAEPPTGARRVSVLNTTAADLQARLALADTPYTLELVVPAGGERSLALDAFDAEIVVAGLTLPAVPLTPWEGRVVLDTTAAPGPRRFVTHHLRPQ